MKCSRCSAELPDSATYCFQCGQSIQSATQSASFQNQSGSFSYLPAGTPPWPTTVPAHTSTPAKSLQSNILELKMAPQPKRSTAGVFKMIGLVLLVPILGAILTMGALFARGQMDNSSSNATSKGSPPATQQQQPTPQPTPAASTNQLPTPTSSKKISDNDLNMLLQYPNNWDADQIHKTTSGTSLNMHPHQQLNMLFQIDHLAEASSGQYQSADEVNQSILQFLAQQLNITAMQPIQIANPQPTIGGATWSQQEESFQLSGDTYHLTVISTQHNKSYYSIFYLAPQIYYNEAMSKYMQPMIQSLQFIK